MILTSAVLVALVAAPCPLVSTTDELIREVGGHTCLTLGAGTFELTALVSPVRTKRSLSVAPHVTVYSPQRPGHGHFEGGLTFHDFSALRLVGAGPATRLVQTSTPAPVLVLAGGKDLELIDLTIEGALIIRHVERLKLRGVTAGSVLLDDVKRADVATTRGLITIEDSEEVQLDVAPAAIHWSRGITVSGKAVPGGREREQAMQPHAGGPELLIPGKKPFFIDRTEVTFGAWASCAQAGACRPLEGPSLQPATPLSLADARAFCSWRHARLPTDAEWEQAARGLDDRPYPWGFAPPTCRRAAIADAHDVSDGPCAAEPHEVCRHPEGNSPYGVCDLAGNVWEWTAAGQLRGGDTESDPLIAKRLTRVTPGLHTGVRCAR